MDAIAAAAGVGKGTVFRRFGDRAGLMRALLNEHETAFQESVIRGEPPLGPGAPPVDRLVAFGRARFELLERHGLMIAAAEASERGDARFDCPVYVFYRSHIGDARPRGRPGAATPSTSPRRCWRRWPRRSSSTSAVRAGCRSSGSPRATSGWCGGCSARRAGSRRRRSRDTESSVKMRRTESVRMSALVSWRIRSGAPSRSGTVSVTRMPGERRGRERLERAAGEDAVGGDRVDLFGALVDARSAPRRRACRPCR